MSKKLEEAKSTHSDSESADYVTPAGGANAHAKRPLDKKQGDAEADDSVAKKEKVTVSPAGAIRKEDLDILFVGSDLSEDFQEKAFALFEGAISAKESAIRAELSETLETEYTTKLEEATQTLAEQVDDYLNLVVEKWIADNQLAVTNGIKGEIAESLMTGLFNLVAEHNINIPDEKTDIVEALTAKVAELESHLDETTKDVIARDKLVESFKRKEILDGLTEDLDDVSKEKFASLIENIAFGDADAFKKKAEVLKESVTKVITAKEDMLSEEVKVVDVAAPVDSRMAQYIKAARSMSSNN
jgi:ribosomal protein S15P/S13E